MQCPNCQMNIKDDAQFCMHCGASFNNPQQTQVPEQSGSNLCPSCNTPIIAGTQFCTNCGANLGNNQVSNPTQVNQQIPAQSTQSQVLSQVGVQTSTNNRVDMEKYLRAYFGFRYNSIISSNFSFGTFFFGWFWLLIYGLYSMAGRLFLTQLGISIASAVVEVIFSAVGLGSLVTLAASIINIYILVVYAKNFSSAYIDRANKEIEYILSRTQDEEERIKLCKTRGGINLIPSIITLVIIGLFIYGIFSALSKGTGGTIENSRKDTFMDTSKAYINAIKNAVAADELKCGDSISKVGQGVYYYSFTTKSGDSAHKLLEQGGKSPWNNADVAGQIVIRKIVYDSSSSAKYEYGVVLVDEKGRGIGKFDANGKVIEVIPEESLSRNVVNKDDGDNRKLYFNKVASGDKGVLNSKGPTLNTKWSYDTISQKYGNTLTTKGSVACEVILQ